MKNRLKDLREDHDLTQQMVADQIGITQRKYSYIETGIQQLTAELLVSLALLYNAVSYTHLDVYKRQVSMLTGVTGTGIGFTAAARKAGPTATTARKIGTAASGLKNAKKVMDL